MSDASTSHHKRTKSAARVLLRRKDRNTGSISISGPALEEDTDGSGGSGNRNRNGSSNGNGNSNGNANGNGNGTRKGSNALAHTPSASSSPSIASQQQQAAQQRQQPPSAIKGHVSRMSQAGSTFGRSSPGAGGGTGVGAATGSGIAGVGVGAVTLSSSPSSANAHNSLEQSVRKFRVVEALRSGDTAAISKAIREGATTTTTAATDTSSTNNGGGGNLEDTTILHLAIQCAELPVVEYILSDGARHIDINARDRDGNTPLHVAAAQGRTQVVRLLLEQPDINDAIANNQGRLPLDVSRNPDIFQMLQLSRSLFAETKVQEVQDLIARNEYKKLAEVLEEPRLKTVLDINSTEFATDPATIQSGGTLLHDAARRRNSQLIQVLLLHGADPFRRDRKGKLPQDVTKDDVTRAMLKKSPAAVAAQRGIQEKAVLGAAAQGASYGAAGGIGGGSGSSTSVGGPGSSGGPGSHGGAAGSSSGAAVPIDPLAGREAREMKGYLKKWTNYRKGYQLRWFVLEDGVLSYYKHQDDTGSACRGAINMRIARLHMSPDEKTKFEIIGKSSVKYTLKANHEVEAKRWFWALNNSIQYTKDQAKEEERQRIREAEALRQAKAEHSLHPSSAAGLGGGERRRGGGGGGEEGGGAAGEAQSEGTSILEGGAASSAAGGSSLPRIHSTARSLSKLQQYASGSVAGLDDDAATTTNVDRDGTVAFDDDDEYDDDNQSSGQEHEREAPTATRDAFNIAAQSAKVQLETMAQVNQALTTASSKSPAPSLDDANVFSAIATYDAAIRSLHGLLNDLVRISRDRDAFWQNRLDREVEMRRMWEESMAKVAREQEALEARVGEAEEKRKTARRILKEVIGSGVLEERPATAEGAAAGVAGVAGAAGAVAVGGVIAGTVAAGESKGGNATKNEAESEPSAAIATPRSPMSLSRRMTVIEQVADLSDSETEEEEFFDAVDAGEVAVEASLPQSDSNKVVAKKQKIVATLNVDISQSFKGYENGIRHKLKIDADNRPRLSLWSILKSMVGKDMTKMTLPVTFNEPTSLLYRCGEDMEYADLLDQASERSDSIERLVYVAAFAASEYASTIGRVAKPFNPLLGETFEYVRPDKNYRFFIEQVSHHPPVGAAWAESPRWTYYGESAVKSKFYGKSFDINPLGTWFLKLQPTDGGPADFYTWKKVTSSVVGIITGNPTVDNYGPMEIKNWTTGEVAHLDFKPRGWTAASAYLISGKVVDADGRVRISLGGRWNSTLYARLTPGYQATKVGAEEADKGSAETETVHSGSISDQNRAFLIWKANERPKGIPFNLTPFVLTFNHIDDQLRPWLAPTDSRLRPDQRAMEEGQYDFAATEKNRLETEQRARRRVREARGEEFVPAYFQKAKCPITGESYWQFNGKYWEDRERAGSQHDPSVWDKLEPIFAEGGGVDEGALGGVSRMSTFASTA